MTDLISDAQGFLKRLNQNNNRDWWQAHKTEYESALRDPALALLDQLVPELAALTGHDITTKLFRPHRDVRFSKDKTPYQTHLHMMWQIEGEARQNPVFFYGIGLDYVTAGAGIMGFDKPVLEDWRKFVDLDTARVTNMVKTLTDQGFTLREPALKRVPQPYDKDHAAADLLRMKGVTASRTVSSTDDLLPAFTDLWPLNALLLQIAES